MRKDELELGPSENNAGVFNYYDAVFREELAETYYPLGSGNGKWPNDPTGRIKYYMKEWRTWQMSDHLPLWVELRIDFTDKYLKRIRVAEQPVDPPTPDATDD